MSVVRQPVAHQSDVNLFSLSPATATEIIGDLISHAVVHRSYLWLRPLLTQERPALWARLLMANLADPGALKRSRGLIDGYQGLFARIDTTERDKW